MRIQNLLRSALVAFMLVTTLSGAAQAMIYVKIPGIGADVSAGGYDARETALVADDFSFAVEREMKESGEKGSISLTMELNADTLALLEAATTGEPLYDVELELQTGGQEGKPIPYLKYKLDRCFVKSWSTSGDADDRPTEEVSVVIEFDLIDLDQE